MNILKISRVSIAIFILCLMLPLNTALAAVSTPQPQSKVGASTTKNEVKKEVKKPVKKVAKKKIVKKVIKKEVKKMLLKPESTPAPTAIPETPPASTAPTEKPAPKTHDVAIQNFAFAPPELKIKVGDSVKFTQKDSVAHTVDTDPHPDHTQLPGFVSGSLSQGQSYTHAFTKAGTFTYHCSPHPSMKGKIIVEE